jgi:hypothetical protein
VSRRHAVTADNVKDVKDLAPQSPQVDLAA